MPRRRHRDRRDRHPVAHAPGLLGRGARPARSSNASRGSACRCTGPRRRSSPATSCRPRSSTSTTTRSTTGRSTPEGKQRQAEEVAAPLPDAVRAPGGRGDHLVGSRRRRVAQRAGGTAAKGRLAEAGVRCATCPDQGGVVAAADHGSRSMQTGGSGFARCRGRTRSRTARRRAPNRSPRPSTSRCPPTSRSDGEPEPVTVGPFERASE